MNAIARFFQQYSILLCVFFAILIAGLVALEQKLNINTSNQLDLAYAETQQVIIDKEIGCIKLFQGQLSDTSNLLRNWSNIQSEASLQNLQVNIYREGILYLWSDNLVSASANWDQLPIGSGVVQAPNGLYLAYKQQRGVYTYVFYFCIKTNYSFRNQFIENRFNGELNFIQEGFVVNKPLEGFKDIKGLSGNYLFSLQIFSFIKTIPFWLKVSFILSILAFIVLIHICIRHFIVRHTWLTGVLFIGLIVYCRWLMMFYHVPSFIYDWELFDSAIYASSIWFPSLGDLLINSACFLWFFVLLESKSGNQNAQLAFSNFRVWFQIIVYGLGSLFMAHIGMELIRSLTIDSQISFNINNVFTINLYTYIGLIVCIIILLSVYFMSRNLIRFLFQQEFQLRVSLTVIFVFLLSYSVVAIIWLEIDFFQLALVIGVLVSFIIFRSLQLPLNRFQQYFVVIFIIAFISSISIHHWVSIKEKESRKLFATKLTSQNDITTDYFLRNVEKKIEKDDYIKDYFLNPILIKSQFEKRVRQLYFTGYLSKFEVKVLDYDSMGYFFKEKSPYSYQQINALYQNKSVETINTHFRHLNNSSELRGYLSKFVIKDQGVKLGYLFILLQPKLIQDENRFDALLIDGFRQTKRLVVDYSYAVYKDKSLVFQSGNYPYRIKNTWGETNNEYKFFTENDYDHLLYTDKQPLTIIISKESDSLLQVIGLFSFIFTFCTVVLILILFVYLGLNNQTILQFPFINNRIFRAIRNSFNRLLLIEKPDVLYIRTRIQSSIVFIVFITLLFTSYFTITFITQKYNNRQTERLMKKLRNVVITVENENIKENELTDASQLGAFINQIADFYDTDITLFDKQGLVMASTIGKIYDEGVIGNVMEPNAFYHLDLLKESQFSQLEHIASLDFQAAYAPVFKNKSEILGYLQLPYFSQKADLLAEISSVILGFINLYVVLFLIIGIIAYLVSRSISYPLVLIQQKLSKTVLGEKNEPLIWQRDDEIGELVKQYNHMIVQLAESAQKLAETEREGAWREIARQIAHEIKNPLTPMKLSIQHLQRAFKNEDPNIGDKLERTTLLLINQIDTLSELANEFSSFAKMPAPRYELIPLQSALQEIVDLYASSHEIPISLVCSVTNQLYFDRSYLSRSVGNIIKNAMQAMTDQTINPKIEVIAQEDTENIIIHVIDNGMGMTEEQAAQIFKPYFSTKISGMGLGLPIVKSMIESGNGTISFTSKEQKGTHFIITFPQYINE